jgi:carbamoyl-phosphate synthase large subunit
LSKATRLPVLISSVGRRVELVQAFKRAARRLGIPIVLYGTDVTEMAPAMHYVDAPLLVPPIRSRQFVGSLLEVVRRERIRLIVPTIDTELVKLSAARKEFANCGCIVLVAPPSVVRTCRDKIATFEFLSGHGIDTPQTWPADKLPPASRRRFPCMLKARFGSAAKGVHKIDDAEALRFYGKRVPQAIIQEYVRGQEYTQDVYCGLDGRVRCVVPRMRIEVRSGEVQKARVVKHSGLIETCSRVVEALGDCVGVITVQCIVSPHGRISVVEINPRFGGGAPLAIEAGADFPRWLLSELLGRRIRAGTNSYQDGLYMLRYDQSVFYRQPNDDI